MATGKVNDFNMLYFEILPVTYQTVKAWNLCHKWIIIYLGGGNDWISEIELGELKWGEGC